MSNETVIHYQSEMDALQERSRRSSAIQLPYTEINPFPVKAGPGRVSKGVQYKGVVKNIGWFKTKEAAMSAREKAAKKIHREFYNKGGEQIVP